MPALLIPYEPGAYQGGNPAEPGLVALVGLDLHDPVLVPVLEPTRVAVHRALPVLVRHLVLAISVANGVLDFGHLLDGDQTIHPITIIS